MGSIGTRIDGEAERKLRDQFRLGARNAVVRRIWTQVQDVFYPKMSQYGIAERLQMARSNLTRWKQGEMSFEALVAVLADCCKQWSDLPDRPPNELLRIAGLARMIGWIRNSEQRQDGMSESQTAENVAIVCCLLSIMERQETWSRLVNQQKTSSDADEQRLIDLADQIIHDADAHFNRFRSIIPIGVTAEKQNGEQHQVPFRCLDELLQLDRDYGGAWDILDDAAPFLEDEPHE